MIRILAGSWSIVPLADQETQRIIENVVLIGCGVHQAIFDVRWLLLSHFFGTLGGTLRTTYYWYCPSVKGGAILKRIDEEIHVFEYLDSSGFIVLLSVEQQLSHERSIVDALQQHLANPLFAAVVAKLIGVCSLLEILLKLLNFIRSELIAFADKLAADDAHVVHKILRSFGHMNCKFNIRGLDAEDFKGREQNRTETMVHWSYWCPWLIVEVDEQLLTFSSEYQRRKSGKCCNRAS